MRMAPERVLIFGMSENLGGREKFVMELYRRLDKSRIQFDFVCSNKQNRLAYEEEIRSSGGEIFVFPLIKKKPLSHLKKWKELYREKQYRAIYCHATRKPKFAAFFRYAKQYGVPIRILHAHSCDWNEGSVLKQILEKMTAIELRSCVTDRFSCSQKAGEWMFGKNADFIVIHNGIDIDRFDLNWKKREQVRIQENAEGRKVYGTVARIAPEKNPLFLADLFYEIHRLQPDSVFWHIGEGNMKAELSAKIHSLGLDDAFRFLGRKENVGDYLNGMDTFLLPSFHEGFPITLVEAQASGLPCLVSDVVTEEAAMTDSVVFLPLSAAPRDWAEKAIALASRERASHGEELKKRGFDIDELADSFTAFILGGSQPEKAVLP